MTNTKYLPKNSTHLKLNLSYQTMARFISNNSVLIISKYSPQYSHKIYPKLLQIIPEIFIKLYESVNMISGLQHTPKIL